MEHNTVANRRPCNCWKDPLSSLSPPLPSPGFGGRDALFLSLFLAFIYSFFQCLGIPQILNIIKVRIFNNLCLFYHIIYDMRIRANYLGIMVRGHGTKLRSLYQFLEQDV